MEVSSWVVLHFGSDLDGESKCSMVWWGLWRILHLWRDLHWLLKCPAPFVHKRLTFSTYIRPSWDIALNSLQAYRGCLVVLQITQSLLASKLVAKEAALFDGFLGGCNCFLVAVHEASDACKLMKLRKSWKGGMLVAAWLFLPFEKSVKIKLQFDHWSDETLG